MKTKYCLFILLLMVLSMPSVAYAQCADIFKQGVALMEAKKYKSAISYFQKAKKCDKNLAKQCDEKIKVCRESINPIPIPTKSYVITLDKGMLEFGSEETGAKSVKVTSEVEWKCSTDANWCVVTKKNESSLSINCKINNTTQKRTAVILVDNEKDKKSIYVHQKGQDAILNIVPNLPLEFGKDGVEYMEIPLECTMEYLVESKPAWVTIFREDMNMIAIKVEPLKGKEREGIFSIVSQDGSKKDYVVIKQYKKLQKPVSKDAKTEKKEQKSSGRKTVF